MSLPDKKDDGASDADSAVDEVVDPLGDAYDAALASIEANDTDDASADNDTRGEVDDQEAAGAAKDESDTTDEDGASIEAEPDSDEEGKDEQDADDVAAPGHWPKELQDSFLQLDRTSQDILVERDKTWEAQATKKSMELSDKAGFADGVKGLFTDDQLQTMRLNGNDELTVIGQMVAANQLLATDPKKFIEWAADNYKVDLQSFSGQEQTDDFFGGEAQQEQQQAPDMDQLRSEVGSLVVSEIEQQRTNALLAEFTEAAVDGEKTHPHFDTVRAGMAVLMRDDPAISAMPDSIAKMEAAYNSALFMNADLRGAAIEAEVARKSGDTKKAAAADKAKNAKSAIKPKSTTGKKGVPMGDLDAIIADAMGSIN